MFQIFQSIFAPPRDLILLVAAAWLGMTLAEQRSSRHHIDSQILSNLAFTGLIGYLLGGRLLFAAEHLNAYLHSPLSLLSLNVSAFDNWGALAIALIAAFAYGQRKEMSFWPSLDALTPLLAIIAIGVGLYHFASGQAFGRETDLPWAIQEWGANRHPTQLYEIILSLIIFAIIWSKKSKGGAGGQFLLFLAMTSAGRLFLEAFRGDSTLVFGSLRAAQILAWLVLTISLTALEVLGARERENRTIAEIHSAPKNSATPKKQKTKSTARRSASASGKQRQGNNKGERRPR